MRGRWWTDFEEVLDSLGVVAVALTTDSLHLLHLTCLTGRLEVECVDEGDNDTWMRESSNRWCVDEGDV